MSNFLILFVFLFWFLIFDFIFKGLFPHGCNKFFSIWIPNEMKISINFLILSIDIVKESHTSYNESTFFLFVALNYFKIQSISWNLLEYYSKFENVKIPQSPLRLILRNHSAGSLQFPHCAPRSRIPRFYE